MFTCKFGLVSQDIGPVLRARAVKINAPAASHADLKSQKICRCGPSRVVRDWYLQMWSKQRSE